MIVKLHKNARTTPAIRAQLAASNESVAVLAKRFNLAPNTVRKWQARTDFNDRSHTAHNLLNPHVFFKITGKSWLNNSL